jgi:hypothetical protein
MRSSVLKPGKPSDQEEKSEKLRSIASTRPRNRSSFATRSVRSQDTVWKIALPHMHPRPKSGSWL